MSSERFLKFDYTIKNLSNCKINIPPKPILKNFTHNILTFGSCFAAGVANILNDHGFNVFWDSHNNQHFSPRGIKEKLLHIFDPEYQYNESDYFHSTQKGRYMSLRHVKLTTPDTQGPETLIKEATERDKLLREKIKNTELFIITLGSPTYMIEKKSEKIISYAGGLNPEDYIICRADINELIEDINEIFNILTEHVTTQWEAIITVSPQRYAWLPIVDRFADHESIFESTFSDKIHDGIVYNNGDKALLRVAIDHVIKNSGFDNIKYFPSYDIVMDELRHIETFSNNINDLLHVSQTTPNYVCNRFLESYCSEELKDCLKFYANTLRGLTQNTIFNYRDKAGDVLQSILAKMQQYKSSLSADVIADRLKGELRGAIHRYDFDLTLLANEELQNELAITTSPITVTASPKLAMSKGEKWDKLKANISELHSTSSRVCIYGIGGFAEQLMKETQLNNCNITCFTDSYCNEKNTFYGKNLIPLDDVSEDSFDYILIASSSYINDIIENLTTVFGQDIKTIKYD